MLQTSGENQETAGKCTGFALECTDAKVHEAIRKVGGIVHGDGNIFFTNAAKFLAAVDALREGTANEGPCS